MPSISFRAAVAAACLSLLAACAQSPARPIPSPAPQPAGSAATIPQPPPAEAVVMISIDAFRADYLDLGVTPNLSRIAAEGARARWMTPSYPALTFPNHYTLVTGLRPDRHGIVHNTMSDPDIGGFKAADRNAVADGRWWGGEPIWVTAEKNGVRSASWAWPGSAASIGGVRPNRWKGFDDTVPPTQRIDDVIDWLDAPANVRPKLITVYLEQLDRAGHDHGPDSPQVRRTLGEIDSAIGHLYDALAQRGLLDRINLIIVSDHGMATVGPGRVIAVEDMVPAEEATVVSIGQSIGIAPKPGHETAVAKRLLGRHAHYECWRREQLPQRWQYGHHPRVPPIVCQMDEGWDALPRTDVARRSPRATRGSHGYDPVLPSMRAVFIARGPAFKAGAQLPAIDNVDVYPLLAHLLGLEPADNDGDIAPLLPALRNGDGH